MKPASPPPSAKAETPAVAPEPADPSLKRAIAQEERRESHHRGKSIKRPDRKMRGGSV